MATKNESTAKNLKGKALAEAYEKATGQSAKNVKESAMRATLAAAEAPEKKSPKAPAEKPPEAAPTLAAQAKDAEETGNWKAAARLWSEAAAEQTTSKVKAKFEGRAAAAKVRADAQVKPIVVTDEPAPAVEEKPLDANAAVVSHEETVVVRETTGAPPLVALDAPEKKAPKAKKPPSEKTLNRPAAAIKVGDVFKHANRDGTVNTIEAIDAGDGKIGYKDQHGKTYPNMRQATNAFAPNAGQTAYWGLKSYGATGGGSTVEGKTVNLEDVVKALPSEVFTGETLTALGPTGLASLADALAEASKMVRKLAKKLAVETAPTPATGAGAAA